MEQVVCYDRRKIISITGKEPNEQLLSEHLPQYSQMCMCLL